MAGGRVVKSGLDHALKSMLGVDTDELAKFGAEVGQLLVEFRDTLIRIETRLTSIERRLEPGGYYRQGSNAQQPIAERNART